MLSNVRGRDLVLANVPFALVGEVAMLRMRGLNLSLSASIGFIALFGIVVLNGVVLVTHLNEVRARVADARDAVLAGAADRLRPVLMTALVASLGFVPMALSNSPGSEVQRPLASVVIGGRVHIHLPHPLRPPGSLPGVGAVARAACG